MDELRVLLEFIAALAMVAVAGSQLSRWGDVIATATPLGGTGVGLVLLATVTSLPELITGLSAVGLADAPDIAVGAVLGSCVFNLAIFVVLDYMVGTDSVFARVSQSHLLSAGFGVILVGVVGVNLIFEHAGDATAIGHVGIASPLIAIVYFYALRAVLRRERNGTAIGEPDVLVAPQDAETSLVTASVRFAFSAVVVIVAGLWLPFVGERIAVVMDVQETFIGTVFVAFATSVPEMVVAVTALRIGSPNMAVSNLLGSNLFNVLILVPEDLVYVKGPILAAVSPVHAISAVSSMMMTGIAMVALVGNRRSGRLRGVSRLLLSIYLLNSYLVYLYRV
jgi:cation:H+ antiporter